MTGRSCLHCALARALRAEADRLATRRLEVTLGRSEPVWLPVSGMRLYRALRRMLRDAEEAATGSPLKLAVIDLPGKPHVEVTAAVPSGRQARVFGCAFPRQIPGRLAGGFTEGLGS